MYTGPKITEKDLVFGFDTGYGVADKSASTRFYPGRPATNTIKTGATWHGDGGNQTVGSKGYTVITDENLKYNGYETVLWTPGTSRNVYFNGDGDISTSDNSTVWTFSCYMRYEDQTPITSMGVYLYFPNSDGNAAGTITDCGNGWYRVSRTRIGTNDNIGLAGFTTFVANKKIYLSGPMLTKTDAAVPYIGRSITRSNTASLIDLTKTTDFDVSNVSFNSAGLPEFDGTNDFINVPTNFGSMNKYSFEWVENAGSVNRMPIAGRTNTNFYKYGANSWRYKHGGTLGEFYHTTGATSGWHHWVVTYDGSNIKVYQDAGSLGTRSSSGSADFSDGLKVGYWSAGGSYAFDGPIPVMRFYDNALTTEEVKNNFKAYKNRFNI